MPLCDPWTSGDGAEVRIWVGFREGGLPRTKVGLNAYARSANANGLRGPVCVPG